MRIHVSRITVALGVLMMCLATDGSAGEVDPSPDVAADVVGVVLLGSTDAGTPPRLSPYARRRYTPPSTSATDTPENVVVYVEVNGGAARGESHQILQEEMTIVPHVSIVQVGTRIDFPNRDEVFHNLFSLSDTKKFNLGRYPPGESRSVTFDRAGTVNLFCDIHSDMSASILVVDTPYFTRVGPSGEFRIAGVPEGRHTLIAWHPTAGTFVSDLVVTGTGDVRVEVRLPSGRS